MDPEDYVRIRDLSLEWPEKRSQAGLTGRAYPEPLPDSPRSPLTPFRPGRPWEHWETRHQKIKGMNGGLAGGPAESHHSQVVPGCRSLPSVQQDQTRPKHTTLHCQSVAVGAAKLNKMRPIESPFSPGVQQVLEVQGHPRCPNATTQQRHLTV